MKKLLLILLLVAFPFTARAGECAYEEFALEYMDVQTFAPTDSYTAQLIGVIQAPTPNYDYSLSFSEDGETLKAKLSVKVKDPDAMVIQVITPVQINDTIQIPHKAKTLMIDVVTDFENKPADYFKLDLPENPAFSPKLYCMKPELYK